MSRLLSILTAFTALSVPWALPTEGQGTCPGPQPMEPKIRNGLYTSLPSYTTAQNVVVHAKWQGTTATPSYHLLKLEGTQRGVFTPRLIQTVAGAAATRTASPGSFIEFKNASGAAGYSLSGQTQFTMEGFIQPSFLYPAPGGDDIVVAGELALDSTGKVNPVQSVAGIFIRQSKVMACIRTGSSTVVFENGTNLVEDGWVHVALIYDSSTANLYVGGQRQGLDVSVTGALAGGLAGKFFRLGASQQAPGDRTGCFTGRLDRWTVWHSVPALPYSAFVVQERDCEDPTPCAAMPTPALASNFDESFVKAYTTGSATLGGVAFPGRIVNHGGPGVSPRPSVLVPGELVVGRAFRLSHDQVVDAGFDQVAVFSPASMPSSLWEPGFYAVKVDTGPFAPKPEHYTSFVVRPGSPTGRKIAVILPTMTWTLYNAWPGFNGYESFTSSASMLTIRYQDAAATTPISQGNNSLYDGSGDGTTQNYYAGWERPNIRASPIVAEVLIDGQPYAVNPFDAPENYEFLKWMNKGGFEYDVYSDYDVHFGTVSLSSYSAVVFSGHPEYWSESMLNAIYGYMQTASPPLGHNLLVAGGNALTYRVEPRFRDVNDLVVEVRRWPFKNMEPGDNADFDRLHWFGGGQGGSWRFAEQTSNPDLMRDLVFGTFNDIIGGFRRHSSTFLDTAPATGQFGQWAPLNGVSPWIDTSWSTTHRTVGQEVDGDLADITGLTPPYMVGKIALAEGRNFNPTCPVRVVRENPVLYGPLGPGNPQQLMIARILAQLPLQVDLPAGSSAGRLTFYRFDPDGGGPGAATGFVLNLPTMYASASLFLVPSLDHLFEAALDCAQSGTGCP